MSETPAALVERFRTEAEKTLAFFRQLPPIVWERTLYTDGATWNVRDVLAHIVVAEEGVRRLIEGIVRGENTGAPPDFDLDAYNQRKVAQLADWPVDRLLEEFARRREQTIAFVAGLSEEDLRKEGRHPFLGWATVLDMLKLMTTHVRLHLRDIRRLVGELEA